MPKRLLVVGLLFSLSIVSMVGYLVIRAHSSADTSIPPYHLQIIASANGYDYVDKVDSGCQIYEIYANSDPMDRRAPCDRYVIDHASGKRVRDYPFIEAFSRINYPNMKFINNGLPGADAPRPCAEAACATAPFTSGAAGWFGSTLSQLDVMGDRGVISFVKQRHPCTLTDSNTSTCRDGVSVSDGGASDSQYWEKSQSVSVFNVGDYDYRYNGNGEYYHHYSPTVVKLSGHLEPTKPAYDPGEAVTFVWDMSSNAILSDQWYSYEQTHEFGWINTAKSSRVSADIRLSANNGDDAQLLQCVKGNSMYGDYGDCQDARHGKVFPIKPVIPTDGYGQTTNPSACPCGYQGSIKFSMPAKPGTAYKFQGLVQIPEYGANIYSGHSGLTVVPWYSDSFEVATLPAPKLIGSIVSADGTSLPIVPTTTPDQLKEGDVVNGAVDFDNTNSTGITSSLSIDLPPGLTATTDSFSQIETTPTGLRSQPTPVSAGGKQTLPFSFTINCSSEQKPLPKGANCPNDSDKLVFTPHITYTRSDSTSPFTLDGDSATMVTTIDTVSLSQTGFGNGTDTDNVGLVDLSTYRRGDAQKKPLANHKIHIHSTNGTKLEVAVTGDNYQPDPEITTVADIPTAIKVRWPADVATITLKAEGTKADIITATLEIGYPRANFTPGDLINACSLSAVTKSFLKIESAKACDGNTLNYQVALKKETYDFFTSHPDLGGKIPAAVLELLLRKGAPLPEDSHHLLLKIQADQTLIPVGSDLWSEGDHYYWSIPLPQQSDGQYASQARNEKGILEEFEPIRKLAEPVIKAAAAAQVVVTRTGSVKVKVDDDETAVISISGGKDVTVFYDKPYNKNTTLRVILTTKMGTTDAFSAVDEAIRRMTMGVAPRNAIQSWLAGKDTEKAMYSYKIKVINRTPPQLTLMQIIRPVWRVSLPTTINLPVGVPILPGDELHYTVDTGTGVSKSFTLTVPSTLKTSPITITATNRLHLADAAPQDFLDSTIGTTIQINALAQVSTQTPTPTSPQGQTTPTPSQSTGPISATPTPIAVDVSTPLVTTNQPVITTTAQTILATGTAKANEIVTITLASQIRTFTVQASKDGKWSYLVPLTNLEDGAHTLAYQTPSHPKTTFYAFSLRTTAASTPSTTTSPVMPTYPQLMSSSITRPQALSVYTLWKAQINQRYKDAIKSINSTKTTTLKAAGNNKKAQKAATTAGSKATAMAKKQLSTDLNAATKAYNQKIKAIQAAEKAAKKTTKKK